MCSPSAFSNTFSFVPLPKLDPVLKRNGFEPVEVLVEHNAIASMLMRKSLDFVINKNESKDFLNSRDAF